MKNYIKKGEKRINRESNENGRQRLNNICITGMLYGEKEQNGTKLIFKSLSQENILEIEKEQNIQN